MRARVMGGDEGAGDGRVWACRLSQSQPSTPIHQADSAGKERKGSDANIDRKYLTGHTMKMKFKRFRCYHRPKSSL
jgi:hypothetical protein